MTGSSLTLLCEHSVYLLRKLELCLKLQISISEAFKASKFELEMEINFFLYIRISKIMTEYLTQSQVPTLSANIFSNVCFFFCHLPNTSSILYKCP